MPGTPTRRAVLAGAVLFALWACATAQMQIGSDEDQDKVRKASDDIKCGVCHALVGHVFEQASALVVKSEDKILDIASTICGEHNNAAPPFTQDYEIVEAGGRFVFQKEAEDLPGLPKPVFRMDWRSLAMKKACDKVVTAADSEIAETVFFELRKANPRVQHVRKSVCKCKNGPAKEGKGGKTGKGSKGGKGGKAGKREL